VPERRGVRPALSLWHSLDAGVTVAPPGSNSPESTVKYRLKTEHYTEPHTREGITVPIRKTRLVEVPALPRDWDTTAVKTATALVMLLTTFAVVWSTWSIGSLLHGGIGYVAATVFDIAWAVCLILEWMARFDRTKRAFPRGLGWVLLVCTMAVIFWHGLILGSVSMAVAGAMVSAFAKLLWLGVMKHIDRKLSPEDEQWVAAQISAANAKRAIAGVRRQVARDEHRAALELLAMEAETGPMMQLLATRQAPVPVVESGPSPTVRSAVLAALDTLPDATADEVVEQLARVGIDVTADTVRDLSGQTQDTQDSRSEANMTDLIRDLVGLGIRDRDTVLAAVRTALGPDAKETSVVRILNRVIAA
jgi:hypothetical protein